MIAKSQGVSEYTNILNKREYMKSKTSYCLIVVTVTNDETSIYGNGNKNFRKHLQVMIDCMGNDYERHFKTDVILKK